MFFGGNLIVRGQLSKGQLAMGQFSKGAIILGGNYQGAIIQGAIIRGAIVWLAIFLGGSYPITIKTDIPNLSINYNYQLINQVYQIKF